MGNRIKQFREELGLSKIEFAKQIGVSPSAITNYEKEEEERMPDLRVILKIADTFDVSTDYLLSRIDSKKLENKSIFRITGLNEASIVQTKKLAQMGMGYIMNVFLSNKQFVELISDLYSYVFGASFNPYLSGRVDGLKSVIASTKQNSNSTEQELSIATMIENEYLPSLLNNLNDFVLNEMKSLIERIANDARKFSEADKHSMEEKFEYGLFPGEESVEPE